MFFNNITEENVCAFYSDRRLISALYLFYDRTELFGRTIDTAFISSAATLPEFRGKGIMRAVMTNAIERLYSRGVAAVMLHPFRHDYYRRFDFETYCRVQKRFYRAESRRITAEDIPELLSLYHRFAEKYQVKQLRCEQDFARLLALTDADGDCAELLFRDGCPVGYHFYDSAAELEDFVTVDDCIYSESGKPCFPLADEGEEHDMVRIVHVQRALENAGYCKLGKFCLKVTDDMQPCNNGVYQISVTKNGVSVDRSTEGQSAPNVTVSALSAAVFARPKGALKQIFRSGIPINCQKY